METITLSPEMIQEFNELLEDSVSYICSEYAKQGKLVSGQTLYKVMECFAIAKQEEMSGNLL